VLRQCRATYGDVNSVGYSTETLHTPWVPEDRGVAAGVNIPHLQQLSIIGATHVCGEKREACPCIHYHLKVVLTRSQAIAYASTWLLTSSWLKPV
jgi:hypothetical protein